MREKSDARSFAAGFGTCTILMIMNAGNWDIVARFSGPGRPVGSRSVLPLSSTGSSSLLLSFCFVLMNLVRRLDIKLQPPKDTMRTTPESSAPLRVATIDQTTPGGDGIRLTFAYRSLTGAKSSHGIPPWIDRTTVVRSRHSERHSTF